MSDLDLRDLEAFAAVARTRNFRRAALESRVSVSSLSQRLRAMEERRAVPLMHRTTRSGALPDAGDMPHGQGKDPTGPLDDGSIRIRLGSGATLDWEFEKSGRVVTVAPPGTLIANYPGLARQAALGGVGFWRIFADDVSDDVRSGRLSS